MNPKCKECGKTMFKVEMPFTVNKKPGYMVRFVCTCGHMTEWVTKEQLEQARKLPEEM